MSSGPCNEGGQHRRENSFGSMVKDREEDLALFQSMRTREHNYFNDDIEASLSTKFGGMSGYQLLVPSTPARKTANDLLTSESGKHDYDWLLTPPGTPLFPSLDHEKTNTTRFHQNLPTLLGSSTKASRVRSQLASGLNHSSSKVVRSIASPRQPNSPSSISMMNGTSVIRSSFAPMSTVSPGSRPSTPSRRPSTPTPTRPSTPTARPSSPMTKPLTPTPRPSTPTARPSTPTARPSTPTARPSTPTTRPSIPSTRASIPSTRSSTPTARPCTPTVRSSAQAARPTTPTLRRTLTSSVGSSVKAKPSSCLLISSPNIRPSSPSRKIQTLLPAMPGLLSDPPPNLRTTLPQRSSSASRGASVSSRPGGNILAHKSDAKDVISRSGRRAISPSPSRGYSSSASHDHDHSSSHSSRDSVISPFIEKGETARLLSTQSRIHSESVTNRSGRTYEDNTTCRIPLSSKRPVRPSAAKETSFFGGSISKKSIDTAVRHMDVRRSTPSGFRPLMSNGPISSFYTRTSSLLRRPGSPLVNPSISSASSFRSGNVNITSCEDKVRDLNVDEMPTGSDKGSFGPQILTLDEESGSQCSEAQRSNEMDEELVLDCSEPQVENAHCKTRPQVCDANIQVLDAFQGKGTHEETRQDSTRTIEHSRVNGLLVNTWRTEAANCHLQSTALNGASGDMLHQHNSHRMNSQENELLEQSDSSFSNLKGLTGGSCNESFKVEEPSTCSGQGQLRTTNLALQLESRPRQDLALELEILSFGDRSEENKHINAHQH